MTRIRPAGPDDVAGIEAMHAACTLDSRVHRWHSGLTAVPARYLADAVSGRPGHVCRLAVDDDGTVAGLASAVGGDAGDWQLGVLVRDDRQGQGLGARLLDAVVAAARRRGARELVADVLPDRYGLLALLGRRGTLRTTCGGGAALHGVVTLAPAPRPVLVIPGLPGHTPLRMTALSDP